jgi:hypothetical protein
MTTGIRNRKTGAQTDREHDLLCRSLDVNIALVTQWIMCDFLLKREAPRGEELLQTGMDGRGMGPDL